MRVFAVQTYEQNRFVDKDDFFDLGELGLLTDLEMAELMARNYNREFKDETPAQVVELEVNETTLAEAFAREDAEPL